MKTIYLIGLLLIATLWACQTKKENHEHSYVDDAQTIVTADTIKKSIPKETHVMIGDTHVTIKYHSPAVRGRVIWGGLVPFGEVWVAGAHNATTFEINKDFEVNGKIIPTGKYALFTIPERERWTFIINKNWKQHLADEYDANEDMVRVTLTPETEKTPHERLEYIVEAGENYNAQIVLRWEKLKVSVPIKIK